MSTLTLPSDTVSDASLDELAIPKETATLAQKIAEEVDYSQESSGKKPSYIGACCVYVTCEAHDESRSAAFIGRLFGVSGTFTTHENWIRNVAHEVLPERSA
jgi:transcription initiation factor TFIIIB Brf1 subunit/transcription initiation factor TFIIB